MSQATDPAGTEAPSDAAPPSKRWRSWTVLAVTVVVLLAARGSSDDPDQSPRRPAVAKVAVASSPAPIATSPASSGTAPAPAMADWRVASCQRTADWLEAYGAWTNIPELVLTNKVLLSQCVRDGFVAK